MCDCTGTLLFHIRGCIRAYHMHSIELSSCVYKNLTQIVSASLSGHTITNNVDGTNFSSAVHSLDGQSGYNLFFNSSQLVLCKMVVLTRFMLEAKDLREESKVSLQTSTFGQERRVMEAQPSQWKVSIFKEYKKLALEEQQGQPPFPLDMPISGQPSFSACTIKTCLFIKETITAKVSD